MERFIWVVRWVYRAVHMGSQVGVWSGSYG